MKPPLKWNMVVDQEAGVDHAKGIVEDMWKEYHYLDITIRAGVGRTRQQQKAIEVYCRQLAEAMNNAGLDQRAVFKTMKDGFQVPWTQETVKDNLLRPIVEAQTGQSSTTGLERDQVSKCYDILNRFTGERLGISMEFPHNKERSER